MAFEELEDGEEVPIGYQYVRCHMIFDVKAGSLKRKARYVAVGHMTEPPSALTCQQGVDANWLADCSFK